MANSTYFLFPEHDGSWLFRHGNTVLTVKGFSVTGQAAFSTMAYNDGVERNCFVVMAPSYLEKEGVVTFGTDIPTIKRESQFKPRKDPPTHIGLYLTNINTVCQQAAYWNGMHWYPVRQVNSTDATVRVYSVVKVALANQDIIWWPATTSMRLQ